MFIKVKVFPDSGRNEITKKSKDSFEVWVKERPVMGLANRAVEDSLALYFKIPSSKIRLIKGFRERNKIFEIII